MEAGVAGGVEGVYHLESGQGPQENLWSESGELRAWGTG